VKGAAHQPRLDEGLVLPQRGPHVFDIALDADADLQLGGGHQLRLRSTDITDDACEVFLGRASDQMMAR